MKTKQKGNLATGEAISHFLKKGYTVNIPINDSQAYDLIVDLGKLYKVQCKYSDSKTKYGTYRVGLRIVTGYRKKVLSMKRYQDGDFDNLFVLCSNGSKYLIPFGIIFGKGEIVLGRDYSQYKLEAVA